MGQPGLSEMQSLGLYPDAVAWVVRVNNQSILSDLRNRNRAALNLLSSTVNPWYLPGFLNSRPMRELLAGISRSAIADRL